MPAHSQNKHIQKHRRKICGVFSDLRALLQHVILRFKKSPCKFIRIELLQIVLPFAEADILHRYMQLFRDGQDHAALGCAVQLGENHAGERHDLSKDFAWLTAF